jgi:hypothetical protein
MSAMNDDSTVLMVPSLITVSKSIWFSFHRPPPS